MKPMLARTIDVQAIDRYLTDDSWVAQQKLDGDRILMRIAGGTVAALNREGEPRRNMVPRKVLDFFGQFAQLPGEWFFDGELLTTGELWLFDLPAAEGQVSADDAFSFRYGVLERLMATPIMSDPSIRLLPVARGTEAKRKLFEDLRERGAEGLVLRRLDGRYRSGKRSDLMLKAKFTATADVVVSAVRAEGRNNCSFRLLDDGVFVAAGSCSLDGKPAVQVGDVIEVRYLYASEDGLLYQPRMVRVRHDKSPIECTVDQLQYTDRSVVPLATLVGRQGNRRMHWAREGERDTLCGRSGEWPIIFGATANCKTCLRVAARSAAA
jgi:bifunctional non-homologous end joining protein LigD